MPELPPLDRDMRLPIVEFPWVIGPSRGGPARGRASPEVERARREVATGRAATDYELETRHPIDGHDRCTDKRADAPVRTTTQ